jgi:hypothetical protein
VVFFNNVANSTTITSEVTFQLNLSYQIAQGNFDPASGTVSVAGDFNVWSVSAWALTNSAADANLWVGTFKLSGAAESGYNYKYVLNGATWENNGVGPNGAQNRAGTMRSSNEILPVVYFNNFSSAPTPIPLSFQVNLATQIALGNFDPDQGLIEVRGSFNNWAADFPLTNAPGGGHLYSGTYIDANDSPGTAISYQFVLGGSIWETAVGNRLFTIVNTNEQQIPPSYFNNAGDLGKLTVGAIVNGQATASWTAAPKVRLQSATQLRNAAWQEVPGSLGQGSAQVNAAPGQLYLRLIGP